MTILTLRQYATIIVTSLCLGGVAQAGSIDFTSGIPVFPDDPLFSKTDMGVTFEFEPTDNLVGVPRWISGSNGSGIAFGGGSGSSLTFEFTPDSDVTLDSYTIGDGIIHLGNPIFNIFDVATIIGTSGDVDVPGTFGFNGGPISLDAGTTYSFDVTVQGAAIQAQLAAFNFTPVVVPLPTALFMFAPAIGGLFAARRRKSRVAVA